MFQLFNDVGDGCIRIHNGVLNLFDASGGGQDVQAGSGFLAGAVQDHPHAAANVLDL